MTTTKPLPMEEDCCADCRYWRVDEQPYGQCRRFPPRNPNAIVSTRADDWCGEHAAREDGK